GRRTNPSYRRSSPRAKSAGAMPTRSARAWRPAPGGRAVAAAEARALDRAGMAGGGPVAAPGAGRGGGGGGRGGGGGGAPSRRPPTEPKYIIPCLLGPAIATYQRELVDLVAERFGLTFTQRQAIPAHFTLRYHFTTSHIDEVETLLEDFARGYPAAPVTVGGF